MPRLRSVALAAAFASIVALPARASDIIFFFPPCTGDCDGDWQVTIPDLMVGVSVVLGDADRSACPSIACEPDASASVACIVTAVEDALHDRCEPPPDGFLPCGDFLCRLGEVCCNPLYGICTPPGRACIQ